MEQVTINFTGAVRRERLQGKEYIVAPLTLIAPGVLNGSKGPLYYPLDELDRDPTIWNGMPIVVNHPTMNGQPVSARDPDVIDTTGIGMVMRARVDNGKLKAEGWFDIEALKRVDERILNSLNNNQPIELSTGLFTDNEPKEGVHNGTEYTHVARNHRPDHLAILPDQTGACSIKDGCGVLVNQSDKRPLFDQFVEWLGLTHNEGNKTTKEPDMAKLNDKQRKELIDNLVANCDCWCDKDREVLNQFDDDKLTKLNDRTKKEQEKEAVANAAKEGAKELQPPKKEEKPVANEQKKPQTVDEYLAAAPPEIQSVVRNAMALETQQKNEAIEVIVANEHNVFSKEQLIIKSLDELRGMAALARTQTPAPPTPTYLGASTPVDNKDGSFNKDEDVLPLPSIDWSKAS